MKRNLIPTLLGLALAASPLLTFAQAVPPADSPAAAVAKTSEQAFVQKASAAGLAEVADAKKALATTHRDDVKRTAQQLLSDHTAANAKLKSLADRKNMTVATTPASAPPASGTDFDSKYISSQIKAHEDAIALFREQSKTGTDSDLRAFATETLPTLEKHLSMLQAMK